MERCAAVCLAFPPSTPLRDNKEYDETVNRHLSNLTQLLNDSKSTLVSHGIELLDLLDPSYNSLSYLAILHTLLFPTLQEARDTILDKLVEFLVSFDARQVRYAGIHMLDIINLVATSPILPPSIAVQVLAEAILRIDPTGSMLTSTHIALVKLAYTTNNMPPALFQVIDKSIVFYPGMANSTEQAALLSDLSIPPYKYISKEIGLTLSLKQPAVLEYDLLCGMIYCARMDWEKAFAAFQRVITFPTREGGTSKVMAEAYKRWVLVSLLLDGQVAKIPPYTGSAARRAYETIGKTYTNLASLFEAGNAEGLKEDADKHYADFQEDGNVGLVQEVIAAYQKWEILNLRKVYTRVSIAEIREQTKSAKTGLNAPNDAEVVDLIQQMVISGMLSGVIERNDDGTSFLAFLPPRTVLSEEQFRLEIAQTAQRMKALQLIFKATNERLGTSKEYIKNLANEHRKGGKVLDDYAAPFEKQVDDEDLMGGITSFN